MVTDWACDLKRDCSQLVRRHRRDCKADGVSDKRSVLHVMAHDFYIARSGR